MARLSHWMKGLIIGIVIVAILGGGASYLFLTGRIGYLQLPCTGPCPGREAFSLEGYRINTPTNMTLTILNIGVASDFFVSSAAKLSSDQTYSNNTFSTPSFMPNTQETVNIVIDGVTFTFQQGHSYTIILTTARTHEFTFTVTTN